MSGGRFRLSVCVLSGSLVAAASQPFALQTPAPPPPPPSPMVAGPTPVATPGVRTGAILGRVVDASSGQPISKAIVRLSGAAPGGPSLDSSLAITNTRGQFLFRNLPAGAFPLYVEAAGYLPGTYGQRRPEGSARSVVVRDTQTTTDAEVRLWRAAAINGTIYDEAGPAVQITVTAFKRTMVRGRLLLEARATTVSDERGIYRLHSLVPGDYVVAMTTNITSIPLSASEAYWKAQDGAAPGGGLDVSQRRLMTELSAAQTTGAIGGVVVRDQQVYTYYNRPLAPSPGTENRFLIYPTVFHPSSATPRDAAIVTVGSGDDRQGVDLQIAMTPTFAISGTLTGPEGLLANVSVKVVPTFTQELISETLFTASATSTDAQGRFTLVGVPPGEYVLSAARAPAGADGPVMMSNGPMLVTGPGGPATPSFPGSDVTLSAELPVTVTDRDVAGVSLTMQPGFRISGRFEFAGAAEKPQPARLAQAFVDLGRMDGRQLPRLPAARLTPAATFSSAQYPAGSYFVIVAAPFPGWVLRSVTANGREILGRAIDLSSDLDGLVVKFSDHPLAIGGSVRRSGSGPDVNDVNASVAMFPADYAEWIASGMSRLRARMLDAAPSGAFEFGNVPPGDYLVAAVDQSTPFDLQDPKDVAALARVATRVSVTDTDQRSLSLVVARIR